VFRRRSPLSLTRNAAQVLFYCHFPDMLLATRSSRLRAVYRAPIDALEQRTTGMVRAHV
jgi:alpha-1,3/alpha-1,6-mannosyltransferase